MLPRVMPEHVIAPCANTFAICVGPTIPGKPVEQSARLLLVVNHLAEIPEMANNGGGGVCRGEAATGDDLDQTP